MNCAHTMQQRHQENSQEPPGIDSPLGDPLGCGRSFQDDSGVAGSLKAQLGQGRQSESNRKTGLGIPPYSPNGEAEAGDIGFNHHVPHVAQTLS